MAKLKMLIALFSFLVMVIVFSVPISVFAAGSVHKDVPSAIDVNAKYLFYMHGMRITNSYNYSNILNELAKRGFTVIGEERDQVRIDIYAKKISEQVGKLLAAGVPAKNITVAGHSQGGMITMLVMSMLDNPDIAYVNFAGCGKEGSSVEGYLQFARNRASMARGHLLSAYTHDDKIAGSCKPALDKMTKAVVLERVLEINGGHELFFNPKAEWLDILQEWAERKYK